MWNPPKSSQEAKEYRYGVWTGCPKGRAHVPARCAWEVMERGRGMLYFQCRKPAVFGPENLYCKQHARVVVTVYGLKEVES